LFWFARQACQPTATATYRLSILCNIFDVIAANIWQHWPSVYIFKLQLLAGGRRRSTSKGKKPGQLY